MYEILLQRQATRYYKRCGRDIAWRLAACFTELEENPYGPDTKALRGKLQGSRRCRVGGLRVVYEVHEEAKVVHVLAILPRGNVYKKKN